jgi:hypothetical protein
MQLHSSILFSLFFIMLRPLLVAPFRYPSSLIHSNLSYRRSANSILSQQTRQLSRTAPILFAEAGNDLKEFKKLGLTPSLLESIKSMGFVEVGFCLCFFFL